MEGASVSPSAFGFQRDGFVTPFQLFMPEECRVVADHLKRDSNLSSADCCKDLAIRDRFVRNIASHPLLLSLLPKLIGDNIVLWGAKFFIRQPGETHPWHTDIESAAPDGRFASVWIGLENICRESALKLIERSHLFGKALQQVAHERGIRRGMATDEMVSAWAKDLDPNAKLLQPEMEDGDALVFDGRLWHAGPNARCHGDRATLLLQYASADTAVRAPDFRQLEWPFRFTEKKVPVIRILGEVGKDSNQLISISPMLSSDVHKLALPLAEDPERRWKPYPLFKGSTSVVEEMSCHVSVLSPGHTPHPPHSHEEEELLIVLQGEAYLIISDNSLVEGARVEKLTCGSFVYYSAKQYHTIRNNGTLPVTYLMFKWRTEAPSKAPVCAQSFEFSNAPLNNSKPFQTYNIFEFPTDHLEKLHAHLTTVQPGAGYEPHIDGYDVAIVALSGKIETLGQTANPHDVIYYPAGQPHGIRNTGTIQAQYLVFEFHAREGYQKKKKTLRQRVVQLLSYLGLLETARRTRSIILQSK